MRIARFFLLLCVVYATGYGYTMVIPSEPPPVSIRFGITVATVVSFMFGIVPFLVSSMKPNRRLVFVATVSGYLSVLGVLTILHTRPDNHALITAYVLLAGFSIPMLMCAWSISAKPWIDEWSADA